MATAGSTPTNHYVQPDERGERPFLFSSPDGETQEEVVFLDEDPTPPEAALEVAIPTVVLSALLEERRQGLMAREKRATPQGEFIISTIDGTVEEEVVHIGSDAPDTHGQMSPPESPRTHGQQSPPESPLALVLPPHTPTPTTP
jgi:hypothetical protein